MEQTAVIAAIITGVFTLLASLAAVVERRWQAAPRPINQAAYEMAYRGMLHKLAGQRINSQAHIKDGEAWLSEAKYLDKRSSRIGWNDAIDDIKEMLVASIHMVGPSTHWNASFLDVQIRTKLQSRIGHHHVPQFWQTWYDAMLSAALYQEIIQSQMRWRMTINLLQIFGAIALFAVVVFLVASAASIWTILGVLVPEQQLLLKTLYVVVTFGFLGGGIGLLFAGR